jgi:hypothetical protein
MIDRAKPLVEQDAADLRALLDALHGNRERYDRANRIVEARSCELEISEATRALAIVNRRATEALDQQPTSGIQQHEVDALLAVLRRHDEHDAHAVAARMWSALLLDQVQREDELREAFLAGWLGGENSVYRGEGVREVSAPCGPFADTAAVEYARSKVGG